MSERDRRNRIETFLYDADGNRTEEESLAVRGEIVELDASGRVGARRPQAGLDWDVDPISLEGDEGELATRPRHEKT
jgi:YD repeat-containing protein